MQTLAVAYNHQPDNCHTRRRKNLRLPHYDYSQPNYYYVTVCTHEREHSFGELVNEQMSLSHIGKQAKRYWLTIPNYYQQVDLDEFVIMPNHIHGIIIINQVAFYNRISFEPKPLGLIVRGFKIGVKKWCRENNFPDFSWQRNYYEHIVRNEQSLAHVREYIHNNPLKWALDEENV